MGKRDGIELNRLFVIEPNPAGNEIKPNEDLNIIVELETTSKSRSSLIARSSGKGEISNSQKDGSKIIKFIGGTKTNVDDEGKDVYNLTTSYTEGNGTFDKMDPNRDKESLGIENIEISFGTDYAPNIKIKFIDVRGNSIITQGNDSKYSVFFELPYPIFSLTIKGFYGKPVTYCLHLMKWNAAFNSETGNFEINAEFIGYTYALLTDMLLGLIRAVIKTPEGKPHWEAIVEEYSKAGIILKSLDDFIKDLQNVGDEFKKLTQDDTDVKELNVSKESREVHEVIETYFTELMNNIVGDGDDYFNNRNGVLAVPLTRVNDGSIQKDIDKYISKIEKEVDGDDGLNSKISNQDLRFKSDDLKNYVQLNPLKLSEITDEESLQKIIIDNNSNNYTLDNDNSVNVDKHKKAIELARQIINNKPNGNGDTQIVVFDFRTPNFELGRIIDKIKENDKAVRKKLGEKLSKVAKKELGFEPTIKNVFRILCAHCEVLLETISSVAKDAEKNTNVVRKETLKNITGDYDVIGDEIWAWPEFRSEQIDKETNETFLEETWIGSANGYVRGSVNEVVFIENLLKELLELARDDNKLIDEKEGVKGPQYYPVSPLDTYLSNPTLITINPYDAALNGVNSRNTPQEITRCLLMRGFLGLGTSIRNNVRLEEAVIKYMGALEAENLFSVLLGMTNKPKVRDLINNINEYSKESGSAGADKLISEWLKGYDEKDVTNPQGKKKSLLADNGGNTYRYNYIFDPSDDNRKILPISGNFDGKVFFGDDGKMLRPEIISERITDNTHFVSNINNSYQNIPFLKKAIDGRTNADRDEETNPFSHYWDYLSAATSGDKFYSDNEYGDTYFKIISKEEYESVSINPDFGGTLLEDYRTNTPDSLIKSDSLKVVTYDRNLSEDRVISIDPYKSNTKALEISDIYFNGLGGDLDKDSFHFKKKGSPELASNVLCAYWHQDNDVSNDENGGTFLSLGFVDDKNKDDEVYKRRYQFEIDAPNDDVFYPIYSNYAQYRIKPKDFGKQRELIGNLLGETENSNSLKNLTYTPFVEFSISNHEDYAKYYFSLFGSRFYYEQKTLQARAFLFLHCFAWNGLIGDQLDQLTKGDSTDISLFDILKWDTNTSFYSEDDTPTLKGLYQNHGSFIKAPKLWVYFIGGLLYRMKYPFLEGKPLIRFDDGTNGSDFLPWCDYSKIHSGVDDDDRSYIPNELRLFYDNRSQANFGMNFMFDEGDTDRDDEPSEESYSYIEKSILCLPKQVKEAFIDKFLHFSRNEFEQIRKEFEIQYSAPNNDNVTFNFTNWKTMWTNYKNKYEVLQNDKWVEYNPESKEGEGTPKSESLLINSVKVEDVKAIFSEKVIENYSNIAALSDSPWYRWTSNGGKAYQINLVIRRGSPGSNKLNDLISGYEYIMNGNPAVFRYETNNSSNYKQYKEFIVNKDDYKLYVENFFIRFGKLTEDWKKKKEDEEDKLEQQIFNSTNDDKIKLQLYRTISSIYNKWLANAGDNVINQCSISSLDDSIARNERGSGVKTRLIDSFRFVDRAHLAIGDRFYLNPFAVQDLVIGNYNTSFYDFIDSILNANNFNFIPLPTFINYSNVNEVADVFKPYTYKDYAYGEVTSGPSFICCYAGQGSQHLNLGENANYPDDGVVVNVDSDGNIIGDTLPKDFTSGKRKGANGNIIEDGTLNIPFFMISYGIQNQHYFKSVKIDQSEFSETDESLQIIEDISQTGDKRQPVYNGQNLFNVYSRRGYNVNVEMMGDAMIQPMMYFQLDDIPMFRGAYQIYKVSHSITPHNMVTRFTGNRVKRTRTPLITAEELFMNLLGSLESLNDGTGGTGSNSNTSNKTPNLTTINGSGGFYVEVNGNIYVANQSNGLAGETLRQFMKDLSDYLAAAFPSKNISLASNGITRSLQQTIAGGPARSKTSKHGAGLAIDVVFAGNYNGVELGNPYNKNDNRDPYGWVSGNLTVVKDNGVMTKIKEFLTTNAKWKDTIKWGGDFSNSGTRGRQNIKSTVSGINDFSIRIDEVHHFEIVDSKMGQFFTKWEPQLKNLGLSIPQKQSDLADIYQKAFSFNTDSKIVNQELKDDKTTGDATSYDTNINT